MSGMLMLLLLLLTGCSKSSDSDDKPQTEKPALKIYVFAPDRPVVTRADNGDVDASEAENKITNLHVWVYQHTTSKLVGHISLNNVELSQAGQEVKMELDDDFAEALANQELGSRPTVDVYVSANVSTTNCGFSLDAKSSQTNLQEACIGENFFGVSNLIKTVPADGLPMSGVMLDKQIIGNGPVYQVSENGSTLANVKLVRAVSKIRFVSCKSSTNPDVVTINSITLNSGVLPKEEFLFLDNAYDLASTTKWKVKNSTPETDYVVETTLVSAVNDTDLAKNDSPASYSWDGSMTGQAYETKIQKGIDDDILTDLGTFYLRESDKALEGTMSYTIQHKQNPEDENETPTTITNTPTFMMKGAGDFSRNHTWIVYAYFVSTGDLIMGMVEVKDWTDSQNSSQSVHNW
jgi:hypothetical protein